MEEALNSCREAFAQTKNNQLIDKFSAMERTCMKPDQTPANTNPRDILPNFLNLLHEERSTIPHVGERKFFVAIAQFLHSCVFEIFQQVVLKKIFLPPSESRSFSEKLVEFNNLFDREAYLEVAFEMYCAITGISSATPDDGGPNITSFFKDFTPTSVVIQLLRYAAECQAQAPQMWYFHVFHLKGLSRYSIWDLNEFNELKSLIAAHLKSKCDWRIYYGCVQIITKIANKSENLAIRQASIELLQSLISVQPHSFLQFLNHWSIKSYNCRYSLVRNIDLLTDSSFEDVRVFAFKALNHLHVREKSLQRNGNSKNGILEIFDEQPPTVRAARMLLLNEDSILEGFPSQETLFRESDVIEYSEIDTDQIADQDPSSLIPESSAPMMDPSEFQQNQIQAKNTLQADLVESPSQTADVTNILFQSSPYLSILSQFEDLRSLLTAEIIIAYQKQKDAKAFYKYIEDKLGPERISMIDDELFVIDDTYSVKSIVSQLINNAQDDSILTFLNQPADFFRGKNLHLYDPEKKHSKFGEIRNCIKQYSCLTLMLTNSWKLEIDHYGGTVNQVRVVMKVNHTLDHHLKYCLLPERQSLTLTSPLKNLPSGGYLIEPIYSRSGYHYTHKLKNIADGTKFHLRPHENFVEMVKQYSNSGHGICFNVTKEDMRSCLVEFDFDEILQINHEIAPQAIKIRERVPDKAQIQREIFSQIESIRLSAIEDLKHPSSRLYLHQLVSLVIENKLSPLPDSLDLRLILNKIGDICTKIEVISDLYEKLEEVTFNRDQFILELILSANYATLVPRERTVDLLDTMQLLNMARSNSKCLEGKNTILFLGGTGAGKSTSVNYYTGVPLKETRNPFGHFVVEIDQEKARRRLKDFELSEPAVIGQSLGTSQTSVVKGHKIHFKSVGDDLHLADFPGFDDTRGEKHDMATAVSIDRVIQHSAKVCAIFLILPYSSFLLVRGNPVIHACARLKELLPTAFDDLTIKNRHVRIIITKHSTYEGAVASFEEMLTKILSDEEAAFQSNGNKNSLVEQSLLQNRVKTWQALNKMSQNNCIEFIDTSDSIRAANVVKEYLNSPGIDKSLFQSTLNGPKIQEVFRNSIEQATHTWSTQILKLYLKDVPSRISALQIEYNDLDPKILAAEARIKKKLADIAESTKLLKKYQEAHEQLHTTPDADVSSLGLEDLQASRILLLKKEIEEEEKKLAVLKQSKETEVAKIEQLEETLNYLKSMKLLTEQEALRLSVGVHVDELWSFCLNPDDTVSYSILKDPSTYQKAFDEYRTVNPDEIREELKVKASELNESIHYLVPIHRDYVLVPTETLGRARFNQTGKTADGKYAAILEGNNFKLHLGMKSDESGQKVIYSFETFWGTSREKHKDCYYDPTTLPWIKLTHTVPNEIKNAARISNLTSEVSHFGSEIAYVQGQLVGPTEAHVRLVSEIFGAEHRLEGLSRELTKEVAVERSMQLQALTQNLNQSIEAGRVESEGEKQLIEKFRKSKVDLTSQICEMRRQKILFALLIKSNLNTAKSLYDFSHDLERGLSFKPSEVVFEGCRQFLSAFNQLSFEELEEMCDEDLNSKLDPGDSSKSCGQIELPYCLKYYPNSNVAPSLVYSVSHILQIQPNNLFDFMRSYIEINQPSLRVKFPESPHEAIIRDLRNEVDIGDLVEVFCLTQLLNCPIVLVWQLNPVMIQGISPELCGDPIFLNVDENGHYSSYTYVPQARKQIELFMLQLQSQGGSVILG